MMIVKKRQWALESTIKNENKRQLVDLMKVMGKDKVKLLGDVMSTKDALYRLGLTHE